MSGFGLWQPRRRGRSARHLVLALFPLFLIALSLACSSKPEPSSNAAPDANPTAVLARADSAPLPSPVPSDEGSASLGKSKPAGVGNVGLLPSLADLVERVKPAVASIAVESVARGLFFDFTDEGAGSGIVVRPDGYIVTNFHVVQGANEIKVNLPDGKTYDAAVVGRDIITDLAVIKIDGENLPFATFARSDRLRTGDWVVALGNARALKGGPTVTLGIVSARGRTINTERGTLYGMIQTDAAINDGTSGGPLVNLDGEVVGISTAMLRQAQGIGFAISASVAGPIIDSLIAHRRVTRPLIGLSGADVTAARANRLGINATEGIIVTNMSRDGPAYKAGIRVGDVITKIDGIPTSDMAAFLTLLWTYNVDDVVDVEYLSDNETEVVPVELAERPAQ